MSKDAYVITDISAILNPENIRKGLDLAELESQLIKGGLISQPTKDPVDKFDDDLRDIAQSMGISFDDVLPNNTPQEDNISAPPQQETQYSYPVVDDYEEPPYIPPVYTVESSRDYNPPSGSELQMRTLEQQRRDQIVRVIGGSNTPGFSMEHENREDMKAAMLSEIDQLITTLKEEDVDISRVPEVSHTSDYDSVANVLRILKFKYDHIRGCGFAEEFLLFGAHTLEEVFNGERTWFGHRPDLTGWHNHVNAKLKRMRSDTGQIVNNFMRDNPISPAARVMLELVPNMVLYSRMRGQQRGEPGIDHDEMNRSTENLRNM